MEKLLSFFQEKATQILGLKISSFDEIYQIDSGSNANVYSVLINNHRYALKAIPKSKLSFSKMEEIPEIKHLSILAQSQYIGRMVNFFEEGKFVYLLLDLYDQNLENLLQSSEYPLLPLKTKLEWFRQIVMALHLCHQENICHLDLKPSNLMLDSERKIRLIDFGCSRKRNTFFDGEVTHYSSPEIVLKRKLASKSMDLWALGVILFRMMTGKFPFSNQFEIVDSHWNPDLIHPKLQPLLFSLFDTDPSQRWPTGQILLFLKTL